MSVEEFNVKAEARKQYLKYFRGWFIVIAVLLVVSGVILAGKLLKKDSDRTNDEAPKERVFDEADVLTDKEEEKLRKLISKAEEKIHADIVLLTIDQSVEGKAAKEKYGYRFDDWVSNMDDIAENFYIDNLFGYDEEYSGGILVMNWYGAGTANSQRGVHLGLDGRAKEKISGREMDQITKKVQDVISAGGTPYKAYKAYVDKMVSLMGGGLPSYVMLVFALAAAIVPLIVASIFIAVKSVSKEGKVTTNVNTYVSQNTGNKTMRDDFIRKTVTSKRIPKSTSSGGGVRSSGGGRISSGGGRSMSGSSRRF